MGEERTEEQLKTLTNRIDKYEVKQDTIVSDLITLKLINLKQDITLKAIMWIARAMLLAVIGFLIENGLMFMSTKHML
jgi:hypothetical protein